MTENVLLHATEQPLTEPADPTRELDAVQLALQRLADGEDLDALDPQIRDALRALVRRLETVWEKKGSFLEVGMSPFLQKLFLRTHSEWASA
jgi:hypothetical protein